MHQITPADFKDKYAEASKPKDNVTYSTLVRDILIIHDTKGYFEKAWKQHCTIFESCSGKVFQMYNVDWSKFPSDMGIEFIEPSNEESQ